MVSVPSTGREQELASRTLQLAGTTTKLNIPAICWNIELGSFWYMKEVRAFFSFLSNKSLLGTCSFKSCHLSAGWQMLSFPSVAFVFSLSHFATTAFKPDSPTFSLPPRSISRSGS